MATIQNAQLEFPGGSVGSGDIPVLIECEIIWTREELELRPPSNLEIYLWGDDGPDGRSRRDHNLNAHIFHPELLDNPIRPETGPIFSFSRTFMINGRRLNEDDGWINKVDEIYARLRLSPIGISAAFADTNVANGRFA